MRTRREILANVNNFRLCIEGVDFYFITLPGGETMVGLMGSKEELINELKRWKKEVDMNNDFMLKVENKLINVLESA